MTYIAFEGIEGCGKSTQAALLAEHIGGVLTRENGGTHIGTLIRSITHDATITNMDPWCEAALFAADRAQHVSEVVVPALLRHRHVVSDRSVYSSMAYQGAGRELGVSDVGRFNEMVLTRWPDVVVHLKVPWGIASERISQRNKDRIEQEGLEFFERVERAFDNMARRPAGSVNSKWYTIDANEASALDVANTVKTILSDGGWI